MTEPADYTVYINTSFCRPMYSRFDIMYVYKGDHTIPRNMVKTSEQPLIILKRLVGLEFN